MQTKHAGATAVDQAARVRGLEALLSAQPTLLPSLARNVALPESNPRQFIIDFLLRYIDNLPQFIDSMSKLTKAAGIFDFTKIFIDIAQDFHLRRTQRKDSDAQALEVQALVAEAYLAHRLFEEVNDYINTNTGACILPVDLTPANIIAHEILGEDFANKLDLAVHYCIETFFDGTKIARNQQLQQFMRNDAQQRWNFDTDKWPSLAGDGVIALASLQANKLARLGEENKLAERKYLH